MLGHNQMFIILNLPRSTFPKTSSHPSISTNRVPLRRGPAEITCVLYAFQIIVKISRAAGFIDIYVIFFH